MDREKALSEQEKHELLEFLATRHLVMRGYRPDGRPANSVPFSQDFFDALHFPNS